MNMNDLQKLTNLLSSKIASYIFFRANGELWIVTTTIQEPEICYTKAKLKIKRKQLLPVQYTIILHY